MLGKCLCGAVEITLGGVRQSVEICQCTMCRRWGGAFYPGIQAAHFTLIGDQQIATYQSSAWAERAFCATCGSSLWYRFLPTGNRSFVGGLFDDAAHLPIEKEIFADEAAAWCMLRGDHPRQTGEEVMQEARGAGYFGAT